MTWGEYTSFPRAILHIDGDSFFASCEVAKNPSLRGKPVVTGKERGIVSAMTYEAKARGIKRGMRVSDVRKVCPEAIIIPSDYETYSLFSHRMYEIVRRYTPTVEEYSIDECFADLTGFRRTLRMSYEKIAEAIKKDLETELGMSFSIGVAATKSLAKLGSKWKKPAGLTVIRLQNASDFLCQTPIERIWGIGPNTAAYLKKYHVNTAQDFAIAKEEWVKEHLSKPFQEIWRELRGEVVYEVDHEGRETYHSISKTKTFTPPSTDPRFIMAQLSKNIESACIKARRWGLCSDTIFFFLKTQDFRYHSAEVRLSTPTALPHEVLAAVSEHFNKVWRPRMQYRASGVTLCKLRAQGTLQLDLFGSVERSSEAIKIFEKVDEIAERYGKHAVFLGSSMQAMNFSQHLGERGDTPARSKPEQLFRGETRRQRLNIPFLGEV